MFFLEDQRSMLEKYWNGPGSLWAHPHAKQYYLLCHEANHQNVGPAAAHMIAKPETQPLGHHQHSRQWNMHNQQQESSPKQLQNYLKHDAGFWVIVRNLIQTQIGKLWRRWYLNCINSSWGQSIRLHWNRKSDLSLQRHSCFTLPSSCCIVGILSTDFSTGLQHGSPVSL